MHFKKTLPILCGILCAASSLLFADAATFSFDFEKSSRSFSGHFADYPAHEEAFYELSWGWENLPVEINEPGNKILKKGLYLSGNNHSDDLFMFVRRKIKGLEPNTLYTVSCSVIIETNIPQGLMGIGGSPGESVYFKAGASMLKPAQHLEDGYYLLNIDKGSQANDGENALVIGNLANASVDPKNPQYRPKTMKTGKPLTVKTDQNGNFWIFLGTDSGFEGSTKFYIANVQLICTKV